MCDILLIRGQECGDEDEGKTWTRMRLRTRTRTWQWTRTRSRSERGLGLVAKPSMPPHLGKCKSCECGQMDIFGRYVSTILNVEKEPLNPCSTCYSNIIL